MGQAEHEARELIARHGTHAPTIAALRLGTAIDASDWSTVSQLAAIRKALRQILRPSRD